ncbi:MAG: DUF3795 domain-containing protein [Actinobacteria bacterium]|nr:DUF3795 domain-containing protein [Actinomycetota bacterium]
MCGLFCPACSLFIASTDDPSRLQTLSRSFELSAEQLECHGCRSEKRGVYCEKYCKMTKCAAERGIGFCVDCREYPCQELRAFQAQMPHRIELWQSQERIREVGWETWYEEMLGHYSCPDCQTLNSAYDIACRACGRTPSNQYVELHRDDIVQNAGKLGLAPAARDLQARQ